MNLLLTFILFQIIRFGIEKSLASLNRSYYMQKDHQEEAKEILEISPEQFNQTLSYTEDKFTFGNWSSYLQLAGFIIFLYFGGFGWIERQAEALSAFLDGSEVVTGLAFFGIMSLISMVVSLPFDYYFTFVIEEKHGFNRQTVKGFITDRIKGLVLGAILGGVCLSGILWVMGSMGTYWWLWAWLVLGLFQLVTLWIFPSLLAPLFNKFKPLEEGDLKNEIFKLAEQVKFKASGIFVMDASRRSSHGNAYFTGIFKEKRIVLFDTLIESMGVEEIVAVLAHELGHFKLNHVRWGLIRGILMTGVLFYLLSIFLPNEQFYKAFHLQGVSNYGALFVFFLWFGLVDFFISPFQSWLSRKNEFAADDFAKKELGDSAMLSSALKKLRESNHAMPISHPLFSMVYHSHPPLLERLKVLN